MTSMSEGIAHNVGVWLEDWRAQLIKGDMAPEQV